MSKTKTKRARRELKRDGDRKIAAHHRKIAKAAEAAAKPSTSTSTTSKPGSAKKVKKAAQAAADTKAPKPAVQASQKHAVPFGEYEHILLVGEGDFSFTRSLAVAHGCANVTGTSFDSEEEVREKYPTFERVHEELSALTPPVPLHHCIDAAKLSAYKHLRCDRSDTDPSSSPTDNTKTEGWDTIAFMFPHTGGLSTDTNRQVRANQALLVSFFNACLDTPTPKKRIQLLRALKDPSASTAGASYRPFLRMHGRIIVTLFEAAPYTLWNIRDLARHAGLKVVESWKFDAEDYPGYAHVRTLGAIEGGGGWKGEEREARMYVFEKVPLVADEEEEREMARLARLERGGGLVSQEKMFKGSKRERKGSEEEG